MTFVLWGGEAQSSFDLERRQKSPGEADFLIETKTIRKGDRRSRRTVWSMARNLDFFLSEKEEIRWF